jgi:hypothetical protein
MLIAIQPITIHTFPGTTTATHLKISPRGSLPLDDSGPSFDCSLVRVVVDEPESVVRPGLAVTITEAQWAAWGSESTEEYVSACALDNLGLTAL